MKKKIIFSSGGTGGHIFPTISLMKYFFSQNYDVTLVTDERGSKYIDKNLNFKNFFINTDTPFNKNLIKKIFAYIKIFFALIKSFSDPLKKFFSVKIEIAAAPAFSYPFIIFSDGV